MKRSTIIAGLLAVLGFLIGLAYNTWHRNPARDADHPVGSEVGDPSRAGKRWINRETMNPDGTRKELPDSDGEEMHHEGHEGGTTEGTEEEEDAGVAEGAIEEEEEEEVAPEP